MPVASWGILQGAYVGPDVKMSSPEGVRSQSLATAGSEAPDPWALPAASLWGLNSVLKKWSGLAAFD